MSGDYYSHTDRKYDEIIERLEALEKKIEGKNQTLYKEKESSGSAHEWSALLPNCNTMVLNDNHESHMVTPLSPYSTDFRYTIQIWGTNEEEHER